MVTPGFESYKLERQYCTGLKILEAQKNLFLNALNGTIKVIYIFENIFASHKRRITPCHPLLYPLPPIPLYRIVYSCSIIWLRITSFSADLISSLCLLSKIKFKLKRKCSLSIYLFLFHFFFFCLNIY